MQKTVLIIGGAGYIGSHTAYLASQHYRVIVLDALVHHQTFTHPWALFVRGDYGDRAVLESIFTQHHIDAVMHFAGYIEVGDSVRNPLAYYHNNVANTITLLQVMRAYECNTIIFSSSCAVYGAPLYTPIDEEHPHNPISPYGTTKAIIEQLLYDCSQAYGLSYVGLRYFNAAGALPEHGLYEQHQPETHLIPLLIRAAYDRSTISIFGTDYDTPDGTCVRDFLHVADIASAHIQALAYLERGNPSVFCNLGTGTGVSVKQMVCAVQEITGLTLKIAEKPRRIGDPAELVANATKADVLLGWQAKNSDLEGIIRSALLRPFGIEHRAQGISR
jgi:UDP-glucose 4-epimerase